VVPGPARHRLWLITRRWSWILAGCGLSTAALLCVVAAGGAHAALWQAWHYW
jgi:hypothetical protein